MGFRMTQADIAILSTTLLRISPENAAPSGFPLGNPYIPFQFPPKVTSEGKETSWSMTFNTYAWEPLAHWEGNSARKITIHFVYSVTNQPAVGASAQRAGIIKWDLPSVVKTVRNLKAYFTTNPLATLLPVFEMQLYEHAPTGNAATTTWRGTGVSIKHGEELILAARGDGVLSAYPLVVECDLSMEMVTNIRKKDGVPAYNFTNVPVGILPMEWY